jgi:hypothetical protein
MLAEEVRDEAARRVRSAAGRETDDHGDRLS